MKLFDNIEIAKQVVGETKDSVIAIGGVRTWHLIVMAVMIAVVLVADWYHGYRTATKNFKDANEAIRNAITTTKASDIDQINLYKNCYYMDETSTIPKLQSALTDCWKSHRSQNMSQDTSR